ncbi:FecR domain-containing protein [Chryseolinea sp. T2]|uniref:FecR family protein n=1 Tax=Chryseolinea sp. T2 TaxID=3129255 RepID=UPI003076CD7A
MDQQMFQQMLRRYLTGEASGEEIKIVDAWYEAMGKRDRSSLNDVEKTALEQRYWSVISKHVAQTRTTNPSKVMPSGTRTRRIGWYSVGIAASLTIAITFFFFLNDSRRPVLNKDTSGQQYASSVWTQLDNIGKAVKLFDLPDGSRISLEPNSRLKYGTAFNQEVREVFLEGEAHFEVTRNEHRPFLVHAKEVTTTVLGTSFRVKAFDEDKNIMVAVQTGKVAVQAHQNIKGEAPQKTEMILTPNQQIVYNRDEKTMQRSIVDVPQPIPAEEKTRRMRFEEAPVSEIFKALEKVYGVDILFDKNKFSSCVLTTSISDGGIYNRLDIICEAIGADYTINDDEIVITGPGCE